MSAILSINFTIVIDQSEYFHDNKDVPRKRPLAKTVKAWNIVFFSFSFLFSPQNLIHNDRLRSIYRKLRGRWKGISDLQLSWIARELSRGFAFHEWLQFLYDSRCFLRSRLLQFGGKRQAQWKILRSQLWATMDILIIPSQQLSFWNKFSERKKKALIIIIIMWSHSIH